MSTVVEILEDPDLKNQIATFRRFNRLYTRLLGTLNESLLESGLSLAECRVIYELANRVDTKASEIAEALDMDPGYLSRLLKKFEGFQWLSRKSSEEDSRFSDLSLTDLGRQEYDRLDALSEQRAREIIERLSESGRSKLAECMRTVESLLVEPAMQRSFVLRPPRKGDMGWVIFLESMGFARQFGWEIERLVTQIVLDFQTHFDPARERCWIAEIDGQHVGHVFLIKHPTLPEAAKLRLLFVDPAARGLGIGEALVNECVRFARDAGYSHITLWTQNVLTQAHRIYIKAGFQLASEEPDDEFGHDLVGQEWILELNRTS